MSVTAAKLEEIKLKKDSEKQNKQPASVNGTQGIELNNIHTPNDIIRLLGDPKNANPATQQQLRNYCYKEAQKSFIGYKEHNNLSKLILTYNYCKVAALAGHTHSQFLVAEAYRKGSIKAGIEIDFKIAKMFYLAAAKKGHTKARLRLAYLYLDTYYYHAGIPNQYEITSEQKARGLYWLKKAIGVQAAEKKIKELDTKKASNSILTMSCAIQ